MSAAPVLDTHAHLWDWQLADYDWMDASMSAIRRPITIDELAAQLHANGVIAAVLVQTCPSLRETREYLQLAADHPAVIGVVGWVDLTDPGVAEVLASLRESSGGDRLVGVRHQVHDEPDPAWLDRADVRRGIAAVGEEGLVYDLLVRARELPAARRLAEQFPNQRFVLNHLAKPEIAANVVEPWAHELSALGRHEHVASKLSGLVTEADWQAWSVDDLRPYYDHALETFGPDRLLYGGDWPVSTLAATYGEVLGAARELTSTLDERERRRVFCDTAAEVYGIVLPPAS